MTIISSNKYFKEDNTGSNIDSKAKECYLSKEELNKALLSTWPANTNTSLYISD